MTASIGVWAEREPGDDLVLYRWDASRRGGFLTLRPYRRAGLAPKTAHYYYNY